MVETKGCPTRRRNGHGITIIIGTTMIIIIIIIGLTITGITPGITVKIGLTATVGSLCSVTMTPVMQVAYILGKTRQAERLGRTDLLFAHART
jgi:hypothetical protein